MSINSRKLATAAALCTAGLWIVCFMALLLAPKVLLYISGAMLHMDLSAMVWNASINSFIVGIVGWSLLSWVVVWLTVTVYQYLMGESPHEQ